MDSYTNKTKMLILRCKYQRNYYVCQNPRKRVILAILEQTIISLSLRIIDLNLTVFFTSFIDFIEMKDSIDTKYSSSILFMR